MTQSIFWNGVELTTRAEILTAWLDHARRTRPNPPTLLELAAELDRNGALPEDSGPDPIAAAIRRELAR